MQAKIEPKLCFGNHTIQDFMFYIGLLPNELIVFAIIYSFSKNSCNIYYGRKKFIVDALHIGERTASRIFKKLFSLGLIEECRINRDVGIRCTKKALLLANMPSEEIERMFSGDNGTEPASEDPSENANIAPAVNEIKEEAFKKSENSEGDLEAMEKAFKDDGAARLNNKEEPDFDPTYGGLLPIPEGVDRKERMRRLNGVRDIKKAACRKASSCEGLACFFCENFSNFSDEWLLEFSDYDVKPSSPLPCAKPKFQYASFGITKRIKLTWEQYAALLKLVDKQELSGYIDRLENSLDKPREKPLNLHTHYQVLKDWIIKDHSI